MVDKTIRRVAKQVTAKVAKHDNRIALENIEGHTGRLIATDTEYDGEGISFQKGDVLYGKLRPYLAKVHHASQEGEAIGDFYVLRPMAVDGRYLAYLLLSPDVTEASRNAGYGAKMPRVSWEFVSTIVIPVSGRDEQIAIAAFLDHETGKIDSLITEQERLIALLNEKRQAVISHAVTKGLDSNVEMKDSGIEWLGEVPAHWEKKPLKRVGVFSAGVGFPHEEQGVEGEELSFHKVNALGKANADGALSPSEDTITRETATRLRAFIFPAETIVFAKVGAALLLGRIRRINKAACLDNNMMGLVVNRHHDAGFVRMLMTQIRFDLIANPGAVPSINERQIANLTFGFPCLAEQKAIADFLRNQLARFDGLMAEAVSSITLLRERRSALISATVTGKIDVRNHPAAVAALNEKKD